MSEEPRQERSAWAIVEEVQARHPFPLSAIVELTRRCDLRCRHCFLDLDGHPGLPTADLARVFGELARAGTLFLTFTGGEITRRPDLLELAGEAKRLGFALRLKSNGLRWPDELVRAVARLAPLGVDLSLLGARGSTHDAVTGVAGSHERTLSTARRLVEAGVRVQLNMTALGANVAEAAAARALAESLGCEYSTDPRVSGCVDGCDDRLALRAGLAETVALIRGLPDPEPFLTPTDAPPAARCLVGPSGLCIRADGEIWRCPSLAVSFGNVAEGPVDRVWLESPERRRLEAFGAETRPECEGCEDARHCAVCAAHRLAEHGRLDRPATVDCEYARARRLAGLAPDGPGCDTAGTRPAGAGVPATGREEPSAPGVLGGSR